MQLLAQLKLWQIGLIAICFSVIFTELVVACMGLLLKGTIPLDYLLTGLVASLLIASLVVGLLCHLLKKISESKQAEQQLQESSDRLSMIMNSVAEGIYGVDMQGNCSFINTTGLQLLGYQDETELLGKHMHSLVHHTRPDGSPYPASECRLYACLQSGENIHVDDEFFWRKDGSSFPVDYWSRPAVLKGEQSAVVTFMNISERKAVEHNLRTSEQKLRETQQFFQLLTQVSPIGIYQTDAQGRCMFVNDKWCEISGLSVQQAQGNGWRNAVMKEDRESFDSEWNDSVSEQRAFKLEYRFQQPNGKITWVYGLKTAVHDSQGNVSGYLGSIIDITERKASEESIHRLAFYDPLTQLPNRRLLHERLKHGITVSDRTGSQMAVLMIDLDKFKAVNDTLGHAAGDELLQQVAMRIKKRLREVDLVARLGGDEFVILLENIEHCEYIARVAENIIEALTQPFTLCTNKEVHIGASIGIAIHPQHGDNTEVLMDHADTALYHAKDQGRGQFAYFSENLTQTARERMALEIRLRRAIAEQEFQVYFQPQLDIGSGRIVGAEALVRWLDPVYGWQMPKDFIAVADESGLINPIGEWVLRETCRLGQQWRSSGLPDLRLAVNISPHQFRRADLNAQVTAALTETGFPANLLELEITESGLMENQEYATAILGNLHAQGVRLVIDDFGTGYSSLSCLKHFPLDMLKIDKTFIDDIPFLPEDTAIAATIISMAHHLGFKVLAEGVETAEQLAFLREQNCDMYQGYLHSKPLSAPNFEALLRGGKA